MFSREMRDGKFIGYSARANNAEFFFGSRNLSRADLNVYFPDLEFAFLKQVHGRGVVAADSRQTLEADAHFTSRKNLALVSQTADCVPVLLASADKICAIHSGWRGSSLNIVSAAFEAAGRFDFAAIGPHILKPSFEVGNDVAEKLLRGAPQGTRSNQLIYPHSDSSKSSLRSHRIDPASVAGRFRRPVARYGSARGHEDERSVRQLPPR